MLQSKLRAGQLDREITFITPVITDGIANSDQINSWTIGTTVWAKKTDLPGNEVVIDDRLVLSKKITWTIRYISGLTTAMRLIYSGKVYEIIDISENDSSRDRWMDITSQILDTETVPT